MVRGEAPSVCWALARDALEAASAERPQLRAALLASLLRSAMAVTARLTRELTAARAAPGSLAGSRGVPPRRHHTAATTRISTQYCGAASLASTQARAGVLPCSTHGSQASFIAA